MKILVIHQYYLLPGMPGGSRFNELARLWVEAGHQVTVVAGTVDYSTGTRPARYRGRWLTREEDGAVVVWRSHVPESYGRSYAGRMWAFFAFTLSATSALFRCERPDVVIVTSPPLVVAIPGWVASRLLFRGIPLVFEVRDLWPESAVTTGVLPARGLVTRLLYRLERLGCRAAARVNVLTPAFRDDLLRRGLVPPTRVCLVPNGADASFRPVPGDEALRAELGWGDRFVVMYAGAHGRANAVGQLVGAAERLRDRPDILIACVGDGPERARWEAEASSLGLTNIRFHGPQPKDRMPAIVNACDVGAAVLQNNPTFRTVYPNKVFDYMACAKPTLLAIDGAARRLVCEEAQAGLFAEPENADSLAGAILALASDPEARAEMGRRGREWVLTHATRESMANRYEGVLRDVVAEATTPGAASVLSLCKGVFDRLVALAGLLLLSPLLLLVALAIRVSMGAPVFFRQQRPGLFGRPFGLLKFRTMRLGTGPDAERISRVGRLLRAWSLDELPELWNVIRGEMSLVGPRPLLTAYLERYSARQARRHEVRPGITGWAQVNGRNALSWEEKFELDVWYVEHWSFWLDLRILARTAWQVIRREGISHAGSATMPEFMGAPGRASKAVRRSCNAGPQR